MAHIPPDARCVFTGTYFRIMERYADGYDGQQHLFQRIVRDDYATVFLVNVPDRTIMVTQETQPHKGMFFALPGGKVEVGETPIEAAARELHEEIGVLANDLQLYKTIPFKGAVEGNGHFFVTRDRRIVTKQHLEGTCKLTYKMISFDDFLDLTQIPEWKCCNDLRYDLLEARLDVGAREKFATALFG